MKYEFKRGDIIANMHFSTKFVVTSSAGLDYGLMLLEDCVGNPYEDSIKYVEKDECESEYVKVGFYDFRKDEEVDEDGDGN